MPQSLHVRRTCAAFRRVRCEHEDWLGLARASPGLPGNRAASRAPDTPYTRPVSLEIGIVGLPNVGKSTLFNALTRASALASNYQFATIEPNVGVVGIPDPRLDALARLWNSAKIVPATVR